MWNCLSWSLVWICTVLVSVDIIEYAFVDIEQHLKVQRSLLIKFLLSLLISLQDVAVKMFSKQEYSEEVMQSFRQEVLFFLFSRTNI